MRLRFYFFTLLFLLACAFPAVAQLYTVGGIIRSAESGLPLVGATVSVPALKTGATTNQQGAYVLTLPGGSHVLDVSYVGYQSLSRSIRVSGNTSLTLAMERGNNQLQEVQVETGTLQEKLNDTRMSVERLSTREAKLLPALFGEIDLIKTLQLKPGIQSGGEGSSGLYVRGGGPDQNLVQLDGTVIYNPSHLFGFFSVFNPDAVKSVELFKGGFPAQFGGRLSSVLDVALQEGNNDRIRASGGLGLISSRLTIDGPLVKDKATFTLSGRRTYVDVFTRQINRFSKDKEDYNPIPDYYFYDLNGKLTYNLGPKDDLYLSGYYGRDFFNFDNNGFKFGFNWGNTMASLRWRHKYTPRLYANTSVSATSYQYTIKNKFDVFAFNLTSSIKDYTLKTDYDWFAGGGHVLKFGAQATYHGFTIGRLNSFSDSLSVQAGSTFKTTEFGVYVADDYEVNARLSLNYGLRLSGFATNGHTYLGLEPRASAKYNLSETASLKASFASMQQYVHLVANSGASLPTDVWYPSTKNVRPQRSQQVAGGISKLFGNGRFLLTNEVYYKWMHRQIDFRNGASLLLNDSLEREFLFGVGRSYGNEVYLEKTKGRTTGWIGYTLSWTERKFDMEDNTQDINNGNWFPARQDRRNDLSVVVLHQLNKRLSLTGVFVYSSGEATSLPVARFAFQDVEGNTAAVVPIYTKRNDYRMAPYHRVDLGAVLKLNPKHGEADLTFSLYNAYNRRNPYFVYFEQRKDKVDKRILGFQAKQVSLFPVIPSVTYNFKF